MDLGIAGRKAIVCASSRGLGRACAKRAGRGRLRGGDQRPRPRASRRHRRGAAARRPAPRSLRSSPMSVRPTGQKALFAACPAPDILVNNNAGPPFRDFRDLDRQKMIDGVVANMIVAVELIQKVIDPMIARKFGRIVNITSGSVKMPLAGLDLSSGARAGLTAFLAGVARIGRRRERHHQFPLARIVRHRPAALQSRRECEEARHELRGRAGRARRHGPGATRRPAGRVRRRLRVPVLGACRLHHRPEPADRRRRLFRRVLKINDPGRIP